MAQTTLNFASLITPADPRFLRDAEEVYAGREDLRKAYPDPESVAFTKWLAINGAREYPDRLGRCYPPVPPESLRMTACSSETEHTHLYTGVEDFQVLTELWQIYADRPFPAIRSVFDFGCGCGRILRWLSTALPDAECRGSDVQRASIEWCRKHLRGDYLVNGVRPPLPLSDRSVDLVVALSVFSHLRLESNLAWIRELARVCRTDGLMLVSTHGSFALALIHRSLQHQQDQHITAARAAHYLRELGRKSFVYHRLSEDHLRHADGIEADYGQTFFTEAFAREQWAADVEVLGCVPAVLNLFQDILVVRPRP